MTTSPDLIRQVEAESVDTREFQKFEAAYVDAIFRATDDLNKGTGGAVCDARLALIAHIGSIITARVAAAYEQAAKACEQVGETSGVLIDADSALCAQAVRVLAASQAAPAKAEGWIDLKTQKPPEWQEVLVALDNGTVTTGVRGSAGWHWAESDKPDDDDATATHWQPIPATPSTPAKEPT